MNDHLPEAVRLGLEAARAASLKRSNRLCLHDGDSIYRILRMWDDGLALAASDPGPIRAHVDLFDGPRHIASCLIVASDQEPGSGERLYEFKVRTPVAGGPAADFERVEVVPSALIPRDF